MQTKSITVAANGKINWTLDVFDRRADGYHEISSIMQTIALADQLTFTGAEPGIRLSITGHEATGVPNDRRNIVWRAAELLNVDGIDIAVEKNIPNQAGLGGGSSDGAAALCALNRLFNIGLTQTELISLAGKLGADVPFFLSGGTALVQGFGELVTPIKTGKTVDIVIVKPDVGVSTAEAYNGLDRIPARRSKNSSKLWPKAEPSNDFEEAVYGLYPAVLTAKEALMAAGAEHTLLCGSGAAVMSWGEKSAAVAKKLIDTGYVGVWLTRTVQ